MAAPSTAGDAMDAPSTAVVMVGVAGQAAKTSFSCSGKESLAELFELLLLTFWFDAAVLRLIHEFFDGCLGFARRLTAVGDTHQSDDSRSEATTNRDDFNSHFRSVAWVVDNTAAAAAASGKSGASYVFVSAVGGIIYAGTEWPRRPSSKITNWKCA